MRVQRQKGSLEKPSICSLILCAVWYCPQSDIIRGLILLVGLISSAVWYCWQIWYDLQFDIICSLILCVIWYCLYSFILFFLFNLNCASTSLYIFRLEHAFLILYFFHYIVTESDDFFFKKNICYEYDSDSQTTWCQQLVSSHAKVCEL